MNDEYENMWRRPTEDERKRISRLVEIDADYAKSNIKTFYILVAVWAVLTALICYEDLMILLIGAGIALFFFLIILVISHKCQRKMSLTKEGKFLLTETKAITKEIVERSKGGTAYYVTVRVVSSHQGGDKDRRRYQVSSAEYDNIYRGCPGVLVRYDTKLDGRPFMSVDYYTLYE